MGEEPHRTHEELWVQYMEVERRELEQRRSGQLGRALGLALPGESQEELERIAEEDRLKAEEGLVELRSGDEVWYKHIDEITRDDRPARIESENARAAWIQERLRRQPRPHKSKRDTEPFPRSEGSIPAFTGTISCILWAIFLARHQGGLIVRRLACY
jgi:hypothetical protein